MLKINGIDFDELKKVLDPSILDRSFNRALQRTSEKTSVQISKKVREIYLVKANRIKSALKITNDDTGGNRAKVLTYTAMRIGLINFGPTAVVKIVGKNARFGRKRVGVKVRIKKGKSPVLVKGAFFAVAANGAGVKIFQRERRTRKPLRILKTLSIPQMIQRSDVIATAETTSIEVFPKEMEVAVNFFAPKDG